MALVEEPVSCGAVPPDSWPGTRTDRFEHPAGAIERQLAEVARLDCNDVFAGHPGNAGERALRQLIALPDEPEQAANALVIG